jgi:hypothetical protein
MADHAFSLSTFVTGLIFDIKINKYCALNRIFISSPVFCVKYLYNNLFEDIPVLFNIQQLQAVIIWLAFCSLRKRRGCLRRQRGINV